MVIYQEVSWSIDKSYQSKVASLDCSNPTNGSLLWKNMGKEIIEYMILLNSVNADDGLYKKLSKRIMKCSWGADVVYMGKYGAADYGIVTDQLGTGEPFAYPKMKELQDCWCKGWYGRSRVIGIIIHINIHIVLLTYSSD